ncbi:MAG TPA: twitching motility protein PilT [Blastocatellia bacterium]|nr:twitching motility protein PilT [Blastocatellia bacterium]
MSSEFVNDIVVVDTNIVSFCFKGDTRAVLYKPYIEGRLQVIAAQTRAELELWTLIHKWGQRRRAELHAYLKDFVLAEADEIICLRWAEVQHSTQMQGRSMSVSDAWIAATALAFAAPLITHNPAHFVNVPTLSIITEK